MRWSIRNRILFPRIAIQAAAGRDEVTGMQPCSQHGGLQREDTIMADHRGLVPIYRRLRRIAFDLNKKLVDSLDRDLIGEGGRKLGILQGNSLVLDTQDELAVLMDYCIYDLYRDGRNAVERMLRESPPSDPEERALLEASSRAYYSLFLVTNTERGVGVSVKDLLRGGTQFMADISFGDSARKGSLLAGRVIDMDGFVMSTGTMLPVAGEAAEGIADILERQPPGDVDHSRMTPEEQADLATRMIRACLEAGAAEQITYAEPGETSRRGRWSYTSTGVRANPNDPCPCRSGRKYRSCCGKR